MNITITNDQGKVLSTINSEQERVKLEDDFDPITITDEDMCMLLVEKTAETIEELMKLKGLMSFAVTKSLPDLCWWKSPTM